MPTFKFKYHPDNTVYYDNQIYTYADFIAANPGFPIAEGFYFEYRENGFDVINNEGHHLSSNASNYPSLIAAIDNLLGG